MADKVEIMRFTAEKLETLIFQKIIPKSEPSEIFFWKVPKNDDRNRAFVGLIIDIRGKPIVQVGGGSK